MSLVRIGASYALDTQATTVFCRRRQRGFRATRDSGRGAFDFGLKRMFHTEASSDLDWIWQDATEGRNGVLNGVGVCCLVELPLGDLCGILEEAIAVTEK